MVIVNGATMLYFFAGLLFCNMFITIFAKGDFNDHLDFLHPTHSLNPSNLRIPRFLDFYTCISSAGTLGVCLPEPYCSYMVSGAILDPNPTKSCSHTMLSDYGCCTLPCAGSNTAIPSKIQSLPITEVLPTTTTQGPVTLNNVAVQVQPASLAAPPIRSSSADFASCGRINTNFREITRTGPRDTQLSPTGKWCWQAAVMDNNLTFKCGGIVLNNRHVLTVAHCVQKSTPATLLIRLGDTNLRSSDDNEDLIDIKVSKILIHPDYTGQSPFQHNLAILTLDSDAPTNRDRICSVCLMSSNSHTEMESMFARGSPNGRCVTTGYGKLESRDEFPIMRMKEVPVPLISNDQCSNILQGLLGNKFMLPDTFFCAGGEGLSDGCEYDGGGPLVCPLNANGDGPGASSPGLGSIFVLYGVVTWGVDCGKVGVPGVYTRITNYSNWIENSINTI
ncbi:serine protease 30-like [Paramacrobiotus metropolitanus]|uniref:serine protease 30-like n=1 Tax=Paramacrobiotus metropolitanus TaxID=2943436 RepID=UPI0024463CD3|nr:serine protease 30-like [Paramacrobiotus metropolitanus]